MFDEQNPMGQTERIEMVVTDKDIIEEINKEKQRLRLKAALAASKTRNTNIKKSFMKTNTENEEDEIAQRMFRETAEVLRNKMINRDRRNPVDEQFQMELECLKHTDRLISQMPKSSLLTTDAQKELLFHQVEKMAY